MIPKTIHYFWFGGKPLPELARKCIASWQAFFPDYEFKLWNEDNFNVRSIPYTAAAYDAGKYAFVSDYARFKVLYEEGGLYFDTDVEVIKPLDDIVAAGPFLARETVRDVNPGLVMGAEPGMPFFKRVLDDYEHSAFNLTTVVSRVTELLSEEGLQDSAGITECSGFTIYPTEYFCPVSTLDGSLHLTADTRSIHHYAQSWVSPVHRFLRKAVIVIFGPRIKGKLSGILLNLQRKKR